MITAVSFQLAGILVAIGFREIAKAEISVNGSPAGKRGGLASSLHVILGRPVASAAWSTFWYSPAAPAHPGLISMPKVWWRSYGMIRAAVCGLWLS